MSKCVIKGCENEADREIVINVDGEVPDALGEFREVIAIGPQTIAVCGSHPDLRHGELVASGRFLCATDDDEWNDVERLQHLVVRINADASNGIASERRLRDEEEGR